MFLDEVKKVLNSSRKAVLVEHTLIGTSAEWYTVENFNTKEKKQFGNRVEAIAYFESQSKT